MPDADAAETDRHGADVDASDAACRGEPPDCCGPVSAVLAVLGRKYALQIACVLDAHGTLRFGEIEAHFPDASTSTLSARLEELADAGLIERTRYDEIPPRVEYDLTAEGHELGERLRPVYEWARER